MWNNPLNNIDPSGYALVNIWEQTGAKDQKGRTNEKCNHPDPRRCGNYFQFLSQLRLKKLMQAQQKARQACAKGLGPACKAALAQLDAAGGLMPEGAGDDIGSCEIPKQCAENPDLVEIAHYFAERGATLMELSSSSVVMLSQKNNVLWYHNQHQNGWKLVLMDADKASRLASVDVKTLGKVAAKGLFFVGAGLEIHDVVENGQPPDKAGLDIGVSAIGLSGLPGAIGAAIYFTIDLTIGVDTVGQSLESGNQFRINRLSECVHCIGKF